MLSSPKAMNSLMTLTDEGAGETKWADLLSQRDPPKSVRSWNWQWLLPTTKHSICQIEKNSVEIAQPSFCIANKNVISLAGTANWASTIHEYRCLRHPKFSGQEAAQWWARTHLPFGVLNVRRLRNNFAPILRLFFTLERNSVRNHEQEFGP